MSALSLCEYKFQTYTQRNTGISSHKNRGTFYSKNSPHNKATEIYFNNVKEWIRCDGEKHTVCENAFLLSSHGARAGKFNKNLAAAPCIRPPPLLLPRILEKISRSREEIERKLDTHRDSSIPGLSVRFTSDGEVGCEPLVGARHRSVF